MIIYVIQMLEVFIGCDLMKINGVLFKVLVMGVVVIGLWFILYLLLLNFISEVLDGYYVGMIEGGVNNGI